METFLTHLISKDEIVFMEKVTSDKPTEEGCEKTYNLIVTCKTLEKGFIYINFLIYSFVCFFFCKANSLVKRQFVDVNNNHIHVDHYRQDSFNNCQSKAIQIIGMETCTLERLKNTFENFGEIEKLYKSEDGLQCLYLFLL